MKGKFMVLLAFFEALCSEGFRTFSDSVMKFEKQLILKPFVFKAFLYFKIN